MVIPLDNITKLRNGESNDGQELCGDQRKERKEAERRIRRGKEDDKGGKRRKEDTGEGRDE